jgi:GxxExxY protein
MAKRPLLHGELTKQIIAAFYQVHYELGYGFAESVYSRAMAYALEDLGLPTRREVPIVVYFRGREVGDFRADHVVEAAVLLELKAGPTLPEGAAAQVLNLLRATNIEVGLLLHFGVKPNFERFVYANGRKLIPEKSM